MFVDAGYILAESTCTALLSGVCSIPLGTAAAAAVEASAVVVAPEASVFDLVVAVVAVASASPEASAETERTRMGHTAGDTSHPRMAPADLLACRTALVSVSEAQAVSALQIQMAEWSAESATDQTATERMENWSAEDRANRE